MHCLRASELMSLELDGLLTEREAQSLQDHLAVCLNCRERWEVMQNVHNLLDEAETAVPSPLLQERIMAKIPRQCVYGWNFRISVITVVGVLILHSLGLLPIVSFVKMVYGDPRVITTFVRSCFDALHAANAVVEAFGLVLRLLLSNPEDLVVATGYFVFGLLLVIGWRELASESLHPSRG